MADDTKQQILTSALISSDLQPASAPAARAKAYICTRSMTYMCTVHGVELRPLRMILLNVEVYLA
jgi:hypothetical protein